MVATLVPSILAQTPASAPAFEVAVIKPSLSLAEINAMLSSGRAPKMGMKIDKARVDMGWESLGDLIETAYSVKEFQIFGPAWLAGELKFGTAHHFDIQAKMPEGANEGQVPQMLRELLAERFRMTSHWEKRELPAYVLVIGKNGTNMKTGVETETPPPVEGTMAVGMASGEQTTVRQASNQSTVWAPGIGKLRQSFGANGSLHMEATNLTMARLVDMMPAFVGKPVIDKTGLKGGYQVVIDISAEEMRAALEADGAPVRRAPITDNLYNVAPDPGGGNSWFTAVERLGLKLESRKEPVDVLVIDGINRAPTEN